MDTEMFIKRVQVEEGFLDGLDVSFSRGLNVVIGERGTGKTSLIELIRFCLDVEGYTPASTKRSRDHALSVLGSGQVTVTLGDDERQILVTRTSGDEIPRTSEHYTRPIIFSQTEIETVGLQAQGRLSLLDSFLGDQASVNVQEEVAASKVRSFTAESDSLKLEIEELAEQINEIPALQAQIAELLPKEEQLAQVSAEANEKKTKLDTLSVSIASSSVAVGALERFQELVEKWQGVIFHAVSGAPTLEVWPLQAGADPLSGCRSSIENATKHLENAATEISRASSELQFHLQKAHENKLNIEDQARHLRTEIEALQAGAGATIRHGQQLRERKARLDSLVTVFEERCQSLHSIADKRNLALDALESVREKRFNSRSRIAGELAKKLGPRIRIHTIRAGQFDKFASAIADVLRGSGLRYNELAPVIAKAVSPRELVEAVLVNDVDLISSSTGFSKDRTARVLSELHGSDLGGLSTTIVEDSVSFQLLDGTNYKGISELSTGQRCTVILPLVLQHEGRVLIVDQPEDHIDNAFIADTLIKSLVDRGPNSQVIFSTHNANIPVLGNADHVVQMGSDGKRGFPVLAADLSDTQVVEAITTVMEGGAEAFTRRASFYKKHTKS